MSSLFYFEVLLSDILPGVLQQSLLLLQAEDKWWNDKLSKRADDLAQELVKHFLKDRQRKGKGILNTFR